MNIPTFVPRAGAGLLATALIAACSGDSHFSVEVPDAGDVVAVVATRSSDFQSGAVSLINGETLNAQNNRAPTVSDLLVRADGEQYFVIERFGSNQIKRFNLADPNTATLTASTQSPSDTADSNPSDLLIVSPTKAYLLRYGADSLWIVNPSATTEAEFKMGEIDLSHYDVDGVPQMIAGVISDGLLYVAMQRLEGPFHESTKNGYVAVIDIGSDEEINTGGALPGIELPFRSPASLITEPGSPHLLAIGSGGFDGSFTPLPEGGIARIDTGALVANLLLDDNSLQAGSAPVPQLGGLVAVTGTRAYFTAGVPFGPQSLYRFDPVGGTAPVVVEGFDEQPLGALAVDPVSRLWVTRDDATAPGITVLGFENGTETVIEDLIDTSLIPINIDFAIVPSINN